MAGFRGLQVAALILGLSAADAARAELPPPVLAEAVAAGRTCEEAGGTPRFQGVQVPGAGMTAEVYVPYVTEVDLNGDGQPDLVTDLAGLECENAWSLFCGSAGCPVTVWLSGPEGLTPAWSGYAQQWRLDGTTPVMSLHGAMCNPPRTGIDGCEERLQLHAAAASGVEGLAVSPRPRPRLEEEKKEATATPAPPMPSTATESGWTYGVGAEPKSWYAGVKDAERGSRIDWICAHGRPSVLALSPYDGDGGFVVSGGMRSESYEVVVENGAAYAPISLTTPLFQHIMSDSIVEVADRSGRVLGRFSMQGAPSAIGQAEGRCQAGI